MLKEPTGWRKNEPESSAPGPISSKTATALARKETAEERAREEESENKRTLEREQRGLLGETKN